MVNIKTVAKKAGVSPTTASCALNNRAGVKPETVEKVLQAARELNYIPNSLAQSFRSGRSNTIAVITHENLEDYSIFSLELMGIILKARDLNYDVLVKSLPQNSELYTNEMVQIINGRKADGVILLGNGFEGLIGQFKTEIHKMVLLSSHSQSGISEVNVNGEKGIYNITEYLINKGYSRIWYLTFALETTEEVIRERGYRKALATYGLSGEEKTIACGYDGKVIYDTLVQIGTVNPPAAIVCWNDVLALQVINVLRDMGKKIPDDIAVTGFDDIIQDLNYIPRLTTIKQPFTEKGKSAMQLLADIIGNKVKGPVKQEVEFSLVARESA